MQAIPEIHAKMILYQEFLLSRICMKTQPEILANLKQLIKLSNMENDSALLQCLTKTDQIFVCFSESPNFT